MSTDILGKGFAFPLQTNRLGGIKESMLAQKVKAMGFEGVLVITDEVDENLLLSSRNLANVGVVAARNADPVCTSRNLSTAV